MVLSKAHASSDIAHVEFKEDSKFSAYSPNWGYFSTQALSSSPTIIKKRKKLSSKEMS
jgi:hypothetical protein